jgi:hypothetical protein
MSVLELVGHLVVAMFAAIFAVAGVMGVHMSRENAQKGQPAMPFVVAGWAAFAVALFLARLAS